MTAEDVLTETIALLRVALPGEFTRIPRWDDHHGLWIENDNNYPLHFYCKDLQHLGTPWAFRKAYEHFNSKRN